MSAMGTRVQIHHAAAEPSSPPKILMPHNISNPINLSTLADENVPRLAECPLKALKHYVQMSASWKDTDQLFVGFGEDHKGALLS